MATMLALAELGAVYLAMGSMCQSSSAARSSIDRG